MIWWDRGQVTTSFAQGPKGASLLKTLTVVSFGHDRIPEKAQVETHQIIVVGFGAPLVRNWFTVTDFCVSPVVPFEGGAHNADFSCRGLGIQPLHIFVTRGRMGFLVRAAGAS